MTPRRYESPRRDAQAAATERSIIDATHRLLLAHGYGATSVSQIAAKAGVSAQTVYNGFGTKAALVKRVYDVVLVGDEEPIPVADRLEIQELFATTDPNDFLKTWVHLNREVIERVGPLQAVLTAGARSGNEELQAFVTTTDEERLTGVESAVRRLDDLGALAPKLTVPRARDIVWALSGAEMYDLLVRARGWKPADYESWLVQAITNAVLVL